jgi:hypothetical protein
MAHGNFAMATNKSVTSAAHSNVDVLCGHVELEKK